MRIKCFTTSLMLVAGATMFGQTHGLAFAQEEPDKGGELVDVADADADGIVTTDELKEFLKTRYFEAWAQKVDADQDGKISNEEFLLTQKAHEELLADGGMAFATQSKSAKKKKVKAAKKNAPKTAVQIMNERFNDSDPLIGLTVEGLCAYNEDGEEFDFEELGEKHVVLVFGCLT